MGLSIDAEPRYAAFTLRTDCPRCGSHLPANGPVSEVECGDCAARVAVPQRLLRDMADSFEESWPSERASDTVTLGDLTWRWTWEAAPGPRCAACGAGIQPDSAGAWRCEGCGAGAQAAEVPDGMREGASNASRVFGADPAGIPPRQAAAPVAMGCPQCGANLSVESTTQRITPCDYCGARVHLPESVWRQLHPARTVRPWIVRFEGPSRAARRARQEAERAARAQAKAEARQRQQEAEKAAEAERRQAERERQQREAAAAEAERAAKARAKAAADRLRQITAALLALLAWAIALPAAAALLGSAAWYLASPGTTFVFDPLPAVRLSPRAGLLLAAPLGFCAWIAAIAAVARRSRQPLLRLLPLAALQAIPACLPLLGPLCGAWRAIQYLSGQEPTIAGHSGSIAWSARIPAALLALALGLYSQAALAAALGLSKATLLLWYATHR